MTKEIFGEKASPEEVVSHSDKLPRTKVGCQVDNDSHRRRHRAALPSGDVLGREVPPSACHAGTRDVEAARRNRDLHGLVKHTPRDRSPPQDRGGHSANDGAGRSDSERRVDEIHRRDGVLREADASMRCPPFAGGEILAIVCPGSASGTKVLRCHPETVTPGSGLTTATT